PTCSNGWDGLLCCCSSAVSLAGSRPRALECMGRRSLCPSISTPRLPHILRQTMHHLDLILTLTAGLATALMLGYLTHRLGLSPIVGYLVGGILVGPHTPGFVANQALAEQLAEVGVILLMFGVGLQFHLTELLAVRRV